MASKSTTTKAPSEEALAEAVAVAAQAATQGVAELRKAEATLRAHLRLGDPTLSGAEAYDTICRALERLEGIVGMANQRHQAEGGQK